MQTVYQTCTRSYDANLSCCLDNQTSLVQLIFVLNDKVEKIQVAFKFEDFKLRDLKNNFQYKLLDLSLTTHNDKNFENFTKKKTLVI